MEEAAFAAFYESTYARLWAYVAKGVGDRMVADDIAQEAYLRLLQASKRGTEVPQAKAYLYRIASNLMNDHWRRGRHDADLDDVSEGLATPHPGAGVDTRVDVSGAFDRLPPRERTLLWLAYVEGYGHKDIARIMDVGEKSVRVLLFRARGRLREAFRRLGIEPKESR